MYIGGTLQFIIKLITISYDQYNGSKSNLEYIKDIMMAICPFSISFCQYWFYLIFIMNQSTDKIYTPFKKHLA